MLKNLAYPLLWQDELQTALYARRVLEHGYPKVHGPRNVYYDLRLDMAEGVKESIDAYIATPWLQYYYGALAELWARRSDDDRSKTLRMRLPFALAGLAGLLLQGAVLARAAGGGPRRRAILLGGYFLMLCFSVSLLLHLREARYYPLAVLEIAGLAWLHLGRPAARARVFGASSAGIALLLVLLFHTFSLAWFSVGGAIVLDAVLASRGRERAARRVAQAALPVLLSALLVAPSLVFYEQLGQVAAQTARVAGRDSYLERLGQYGWFLLRYECLAPALAALALRRLAGVRRGPAVAASRFLALVVLLHVPLVAGLPLFFERYVVILSPALAAIFLLELASAAEGLHGPGRARAALAIGLATALALGSAALRLPELAGRIDELRDPRRGPLDVAIARIRELHPRPAELLVATSYEAGAYVYYLGSRVVVGMGGARGAPRPGELPDLVVVRRAWKPEAALLQRILAAGRYTTEFLPAPDLATNNLPELWQPRLGWLEHRFDLCSAALEVGRLELHRREPARMRPGE